MNSNNIEHNNVHNNTIRDDLSSELKNILIEDFERRIKQYDSVSEKQRIRLCNLLDKDNVSASDILYALANDDEED